MISQASSIRLSLWDPRPQLIRTRAPPPMMQSSVPARGQRLAQGLPRPMESAQYTKLPPSWIGAVPLSRLHVYKPTSAWSVADWHAAFSTGPVGDKYGGCSFLILSDDDLLEVCGFLPARTCALLRLTCRRLRLLVPRPHISSLDIRIFPRWESTLVVGRGDYCTNPGFLPLRTTLRAPGGAMRIEIEVEFDAVEAYTLPAVSLELCRSHAPTLHCHPAVIAALSPLPLINLDPHVTRSQLPCRQRAHIVLTQELPIIASSRPGDVYRLLLDDVPHAPPTDRAQPWRFVTANRVLSCRMIVVSVPPPQPPHMPYRGGTWKSTVCSGGPPRTSVGKVPDSFPEGPGFDSR